MLIRLIAWLDVWYNKYAVMMLSAAIGLFAYERVEWSKLSASDWGTWVGSIGTVLTLCGTIWLASADMRRRLRSETVLARLQSAAMYSRVEYASVILKNVEQLLLEAAANDNELSSVLNRCQGYVSEIEIWSVEEALPFAPLPNFTAERLVESASVTKILLRLLSGGVSFYDTVEARAEHVRNISSVAGEARKLTQLTSNKLQLHMQHPPSS
jgi:hypothetical protein